MRAGKLDRIVTLQNVTRVSDGGGGQIETWTDFATLRAQLVQASTEEFLRGYGETEDIAVIFRTRWLDGVNLQHRVSYAGKFLNIREIKEIGRRRGLEIRCEQVRS